MSRVIMLCAVMVMTAVVADEPTAEQKQLMREFGLTIPPVILDMNGHDKAVRKKERLPDPAIDPEFSTLEQEKVVLMNQLHLTVKPRLLDVSGKERVAAAQTKATTQDDAVFGAWETPKPKIEGSKTVPNDVIPSSFHASLMSSMYIG